MHIKSEPDPFKPRGNYHEAVPEVREFYRSHNGYDDELIWAAAWLYKATRIRKYLDEAQKNYIRIGGPYQTAQIYSWDNKLAGCQVSACIISKNKSFIFLSLFLLYHLVLQ